MRPNKGSAFIPILLFAFFILSPSLQGADWDNLFKDLFGLKRGPRIEEKFHKLLPLRSGGSFSLSNINGTVSVSTWSREEVEIHAAKSTRYSREQLERVQIEIESSPDSVSVKTVYPKLRNIRVNVEYEVKVPAGVNLERVSSVNGNVDINGPFSNVSASTTNGKVGLRKASGKIHLSTTNGGIEAEEIRGELEAKTVNGSIHLEINGLTDDMRVTTVNGSVSARFYEIEDINANLSVKTVNGRITSDIPVTLKDFRMSRHRLEGQIGAGGPEIYIRTVNGSIRIEK